MLPSYEKVFSSIGVTEEQFIALKETNKQKLKIYYWLVWMSLLASIMILYVSYGIYEEESFYPWIAPLVFVIIVLLLIRKKRGLNKSFIHQFKTLVVAPFASQLLQLAQLPNETEQYEKYCHYDPKERVSSDLITESDLFATKITKTTGEDLFTGKYGLTEFQFSELELKKEEDSSDSDGGTSKITITFFKGVLFIADFKKDFSGLTVIESTLLKTDKGLGKLADKMINKATSTANSRANKKILLEDAEFNRHFIVKTSDEIEARYILSSSMMAQLLNFVKSHKNEIKISFNNSKMFIAFSSPKNFFEQGIDKQSGKYNLEGVYEELTLFLSFVEEFDLNTRIWSKQ